MVGSGSVSHDPLRVEVDTLLLLRLLPGVGDRTAAHLLRVARSSDQLLRKAKSVADRWARARGRAPSNLAAIEREAEQVRRRCGDLGVQIVGRGADGYPSALDRLDDPPPVLFLRGNGSLLERQLVSVVGARKATSYGRRMAERLARELAETELVVMSGLALGIDGIAHRTALEGGGTTVAVLGSGPDIAHPPSHRRLFCRIVREGLVVSEFPPGTPPRAHHFPRRNRILAALPEAVVVVEAGRGSGALITANRALSLDREVLAVPGAVEDPAVRGNLDLFRDGARVAAGAECVYRALRWPWPPERKTAPDPFPEDPADVEASLLLSLLAERGAQSVDAMVRDSGLPARRIAALLSVLELDGRVRRRPGRLVELAPARPRRRESPTE